MPTKHKRYQTEYGSHFHPLGARRPHTVKGEFNRSYSCDDLRSVNSSPRAGLTSMHLGNSLEPQLQRKKIVPYRKNHNILATETTKELPDRVWLSFDEQSSVVSENSNHDHKHNSKSHQSSHFKKNTVARESPILAAEKKLLAKSPAKKSPPYVSDGINRKSTYSKDFVNYKSNNLNSKPRKKMAPPNTHSKTATSPDRLPPAGIKTATSFGDKRLIQPSDNSNYIRPKNDKNSRVFDSEYKSHYKSPTAKTKFKYVDGIWIEAPATLDRDTYEEENRLEEVEWYRQVLERRNEAYSHAHRARGTHFSRENLNRYNQEQALYAETSPRSVSSASLRNASTVNGTYNDKRKPRSEEKQQRVPREAWSNVCDYGGSETAASITDSLSESGEIGFLERGRSPTPELRESGKTRRHHLDVTTNLFHDSFEESPAASRTKKNNNSSKEVSRRGVTIDSSEIDDNRRKVNDTSPPSSVGSGYARMKSRHTREEKNNRIKNKEHPLSDSPATSVGLGSEIGSYVPQQERDEDVMSEAAMSSRASVASETLDRARKRRDEFWDR